MRSVFVLQKVRYKITGSCNKCGKCCRDIRFKYQYTEKEFPKFYGWGHSTFKYAIEQSLGCGVKQLLFFHHDPGRSDEKLDALKRMCDKYINNKGKLHAMPAYEGLEIFL